MSIELLVAVPLLMLCIVAVLQFGLELAGAVVVHQSAVVGAGRCSTFGRLIWSGLDDDTAAAVQLQLTAANLSIVAANDLQVIVQERVFDPKRDPGLSGQPSPLSPPLGQYLRIP
jgi:hypothetical protein